MNVTTPATGLKKKEIEIDICSWFPALTVLNGEQATKKFLFGGIITFGSAIPLLLLEIVGGRIPKFWIEKSISLSE